jgi:hypothetical protein
VILSGPFFLKKRSNKLTGMLPRPLDPRIVNVCYDANAFDRTGGSDDAAVDRLLGLIEAQEFVLVTPRTVRAEIDHPNTPAAVKEAVLPHIFTISTGLTQGEMDIAGKIRTILQGNAKPGKHDADASHLAEAAKYGGYFITHDQRILSKLPELRQIIAPHLQIVSLADFLAIYDHYLAQDADGVPPPRQRRI